MARQYIGGPPNMDPYAEQIDSGNTFPAHITYSPELVAEFLHRRRPWWQDVYESSIIRGLTVVFVMVFCIGIGILIARVTS